MKFLVSKITRTNLDKLISKYETTEKVLEIGSWGKPGYIKYFPNRVGVDIRKGENVKKVASVYDLPFGEKEAVVESVKETIRQAAPGGGYILSSSNSIHPGCKGENVIAMFEAAKKYGVYPLSI